MEELWCCVVVLVCQCGWVDAHAGSAEVRVLLLVLHITIAGMCVGVGVSVKEEV